jgi:hypothetical protein
MDPVKSVARGIELQIGLKEIITGTSTCER